MKCKLTLGSLFDGIGGFPLAAVREGLLPIWASEIAPVPISITKKHFPDMRHLGDIRKINGAEIEPVDIISFGSPCQDLSISGKRAGLNGERSGLFLEALRVIKEMRIATKRKYPTGIVWENVTGVFSSNKGRDFQTIIEEITKIAMPGISIPRPSGKFKWLASGFVLGDNFSLAWRTLDAQYWGVAQRRRRIFIVADFTSQRAAEILFEQESEKGNFEKGKKAGDCVAGNVEKGFEQYAIDIGYSTDRIQLNAQSAVTLRANGGGNGANTGLYCLPVNFICHGFGDYKSGNVSKTILSRDDITTSDLIVSGYDVRRLTPLECERLQGFPDGWTEYGIDGKRISDNQRYKALGNSVAIPCVQFVLSGMKK
ncbi:DNA cytosine methyltransferase [Treponema sp. R80B11-R83G3]